MAERLRASRPEDPETPGARSVLSRRTLLGVGAGLAAGSFLSAAPAGFPHVVRRRASFEGLTEAWTDLASGLLAEELSPDEYLFHLEAEIARVGPGDVPERSSTVYDKDGLKTGPAWIGQGFFLVVLELAPGTVVRPHDHPAHTVVTTLKQGSCRYRHFDRVGEVAPGGERTLRCTRDGVLSVWESTEVSTLRDNVHEFTAGPEGERIGADTGLADAAGAVARRIHRARIGEGF